MTLYLEHTGKPIVIKDYPVLAGKNNSPVFFEVHSFLQKTVANDGKPLDQQLAYQEYADAVEQFNLRNKDAGSLETPSLKITLQPMKAPYLLLWFRKNPTSKLCESPEALQPVKIFQSARHVVVKAKDGAQFSTEEALRAVVDQQNKDYCYFESLGFTCVRQKIEMLVGNVPGLPQTALQMSNFPSLYFEVHIKVESTVDEENLKPIGDEEMQTLLHLSTQISKELDIAVPLSCNVAPPNVDPCALSEKMLRKTTRQRYLNARFNDFGVQDIEVILKDIKEKITQSQTVRFVKAIFELVLADSNRGMDHGWIDDLKRSDEYFDAWLADRNN